MRPGPLPNPAVSPLFSSEGVVGAASRLPPATGVSRNRRRESWANGPSVAFRVVSRIFPAYLRPRSDLRVTRRISLRSTCPSPGHRSLHSARRIGLCSGNSAAAIALPTRPPLHVQARSERGSQRPCPRQDMNWRPRIRVRREGANSWRYIRIRLCCRCCSVRKECPTRSASRKNTGARNRWRGGSETSWSSPRLFGTRLARSSTA